MEIKRSLLFLVIFFWAMAGWAHGEELNGRVFNALSGEPLAAVELRSPDARTLTADDGSFSMPATAAQVIVRAAGYRPQAVNGVAAEQIALEPILPKALYLSFWAAGSQEKRRELLQLLDATDANALVIDLKTSRGDIAYRSKIPLAYEIGAQRLRPLKDLPDFLAQLKARGIYTIGRIVVFKDDRLAKQHPELAALRSDGEIWQDREQLSWTDPFSRRVWDYNSAVAEEAARFGFDEIQFDYIRFPSKSDLVFSEQADDESRVAAIDGFLERARERIAGYPTCLSMNIFGYICWKHKDGKIGQRLVDLAERVDYLSPMLYPSGFPRGIPGYNNPVTHPYQVIAHSLQIGQKLSGLPAVRFRPWLQAFRDYAFDRRQFKAEEIQAQINASDASGSHGWMLWNAASRFQLASLQQQPAADDLKLVDVAPKEVEPTIVSKADQPDAKLSAM